MLRVFAYTGGVNRTTTFSLESQGNANAILIAFDNNEEDFCIHSIKVNECKNSFNKYRVILFFVVFFLVAFGWSYRKEKYEYQRKDSKVIFVIIGTILVIFCIFIWKACAVHGVDNIEYKKENLGQNIYLYMFDSWKKGITYLDIDADSKLLELQNVYDRSERDAEGCSYMWDYAYYDGKYFSYYGITPLVLVYIPYNIVTGMLPNDFVTGLILNILNMVALCCVFYSILELFEIKCNLVLIVLESFAVAAGSMMYSLQSCANQLYNLNLCTCFCMLLFIFSSIRAYISRCATQYVYIFIAGLSAVLLVESRPNAIISAGLFVAPLYLLYLQNQNVEKRKKFILVGCFVMVLGIGAVWVCWYNYSRFGNIIDFGKNYQLTAYDANYYNVTIEIKKIICSIYYYLFEAPSFIGRFPFIVLNDLPVDGMGHYVLKDPNMGIVFIPFIFGILFIHYVKKKKRENKMLLFGIIGSFICIYLDFNLGGVQLRYHTDYVLVLLLIAFVSIAEADAYFETFADGKIFRKMFSGLCLLTIFVGAMLVFSNQLNIIKEQNPIIYSEIVKLFTVD